MMTNQTPVEYCRHCREKIVPCPYHSVEDIQAGSCLGYIHPPSQHHCSFAKAEPADPPQQQTVYEKTDSPSFIFKAELRHQHCVFCGESLPSASTICNSVNNTTLPDTAGKRHHAYLASTLAESEEVRRMLKENDREGLAAYANRNNRERAKQAVSRLNPLTSGAIYDMWMTYKEPEPKECSDCLWNGCAESTCGCQCHKVKAGTQMEERKPPLCKKCGKPKDAHEPRSTSTYGKPLGLEPTHWLCVLSPYSSVVSLYTPDDGESANREPQASHFDLEEIGRIMHESWIKTMRAQGYHNPAEPCTVDAASHSRQLGCGKCHDALIPWEQLPERKKDINRHAFDAVLPYFKAKVERELQELRARLDAEYKADEEVQKIAEAQELEITSLRGLVGRMLVFSDHGPACPVGLMAAGLPLACDCGYTDVKSKAEAAIKETHNG